MVHKRVSFALTYARGPAGPLTLGAIPEEASKLDETAPIAVDHASSLSPATPAAMEDVYKSIWQLTEEVLELLRSRSTGEVRKRKRPDLLWLDDLTESQGNTVIAVRQLCETCPEGVTLKKLAETIGVTAAAASVMVELLVKKKILKRTRSKSDRRAVLIRLTPDTSRLFEISEQSLVHSFASLEESLGPDILRDWQKTLATAAAALRQVVGTRTPREPAPAEATPDGDGQPDRA